MNKPIDLVGLRVGILTVLSIDERHTGRHRKWIVACDCGVIKSISGDALRSQKRMSCGCVSRAEKSQKLRRDLSGMVFGHLTAKRYVHLGIGKGPAWECSCTCGAMHVCRAGDLVSGNTISCGCKKSEMVALLGPSRRIPVIGRRFGRLLVVADAGSLAGKGRVNYLSECRCDCGTVKIISNSRLVAGSIISCGCAVYDQPGLLPEKIRARAAVGGNVRRAKKAESSGKFTVADVQRIYKEQRGKCAGPRCGVKLGKKFHRDHKVALSIGGSNDASNIELLCPVCNMRKKDKDPIDWANENGMLC